jgi:hypothetical protein
VVLSLLSETGFSGGFSAFNFLQAETSFVTTFTSGAFCYWATAFLAKQQMVLDSDQSYQLVPGPAITALAFL